MQFNPTRLVIFTFSDQSSHLLKSIHQISKQAVTSPWNCQPQTTLLLVGQSGAVYRPLSRDRRLQHLLRQLQTQSQGRRLPGSPFSSSQSPGSRLSYKPFPLYYGTLQGTANPLNVSLTSPQTLWVFRVSLILCLSVIAEASINSVREQGSKCPSNGNYLVWSLSICRG